jgi:mannose-6-phosphate isomerase
MVQPWPGVESMTLPILRMTPYLTPRPWGGERLGNLFGKPVPPGEKVGEAWELSDHPEGPSRIAGGPFDGWLFGDVLRAHPRGAIGRDAAPACYPLLIKYIDAGQDLSIQVHPDDGYARRQGLIDRGKTECWYVMDCNPGARIIYGLRPGTTRADLEHALSRQSVPEVVQHLPITPGMFLFVPPGTVHAILGGTLLCEIQQSSNLTYRLWDWERQPPRPLHIQEALEVIEFDPEEPRHPFPLPPPPSAGSLVVPLTHNPYFEVDALRLAPGCAETIEQPGCGFVLNGVAGGCDVSGEPLMPGQTLFVPADIKQVTVQAGGQPATVLISRSNE